MKNVKEKLSTLFKRFKIDEISLSTESAAVAISYTNWDAEAAWQLYVELLTRIATQPLNESDGDEQTALDSIYKIFEITREILKNYGKNAKSFTRIAIIILNKKVRPFTAKWHKKSLNGSLNNQEEKNTFRTELESLRILLVKYTKLLAEMAKVEDLTEITD